MQGMRRPWSWRTPASLRGSSIDNGGRKDAWAADSRAKESRTLRMEEARGSRACEKCGAIWGACGYPLAAFLENGGGREGCDGSLGGEEVSRPGCGGRTSADPGAREPGVASYSSDISECAAGMEFAETAKQERSSLGRWPRPGSISSRTSGPGSSSSWACLATASPRRRFGWRAGGMLRNSAWVVVAGTRYRGCGTPEV